MLAQPGPKRGEGIAAVVHSITTASPDRIAPVCRHFTQCGGCALQHWRAEPAAAWKAGLLGAALRRAGFANIPLHPTITTPPGTRRRMDLAIHRAQAGKGGGAGGRLRLGLHQARGREVIDLVECPVLDPALAALIPPLRALLSGLAVPRREGSAIANLLDSGPDLLLRLDVEPNVDARQALIAFARANDLPRLSWALGTGPAEPIVILRSPVTRLAGVAVNPAPGAFLQASATGAAAITAAVLAGLPEKLPARATIAELYAGMGTLTLALAARARVVAWEGDAEAVTTLRAAANGAGLANRISITQRDLARRPIPAKELASVAAIVLDPPYAGAPAQMADLAAARVARVIYVSCNPAALARDAAILRAAGYRVLAATPIDQFLWSPRLESVTVFARG